jgi:hypothetical protein
MKGSIMRQRRESRLLTDFEELGRQAMMTTGSIDAAKPICACHIRELQEELKPEIRHLEAKIGRSRNEGSALHSILYERLIPVCDAAMIRHAKLDKVLLVIFIALAVVADTSATATFIMLGYSLLISAPFGLLVSASSTAIGHLAFERLLHHRPILAILVAASFVLLGWGAVELGRARGLLMTAAVSSTVTNNSSTSFVNDPSSQQVPEGDANQSAGTERDAHHLIGQAVLKCMIAAEIMLGIVLGMFLQLRTDRDFCAWRHLNHLLNRIRSLERERDQRLSIAERGMIACTAGILKAQHAPQPRRHPPFHRLAVLPFVVLGLISSEAQTTNREETILLDVSASINNGGAKSDLFKQYQFAVRQLLLTEPAQSSVWVSLISANSFGAVRELLSGWTPDKRGVFSDDLTNARRQLASAFASKAASYSPVSAGTDIFGALSHAKVLMESQSDSQNKLKEIWIVSDMVHEGAGFSMPALLPSGPLVMLREVSAKGLLVPMRGYHIHVIGASVAGLTPQSWNTIHEFWRLYFKEAGAAALSYGAEPKSTRD